MKNKFSIALTSAVILAMILTTLALADTITPDSDILTLGDQATRNLGIVAPGATLTPQVSFTLVCAGNNHVDNPQSVSITFTLAGSTVPAGGSLSATTAMVGETSGDVGVPTSWPDDGAGCPDPAPAPIGDNGNSTVSITAPTVAGTYTYRVKYNATPTPAGSGDSSAVTGSVFAEFTLTVSSPSTPTSTPTNSPTPPPTNTPTPTPLPDTTAPSINCTVPNQSIWYSTDVTVPCTASDSGSGLADSADASFSLTTSVAAGSETASAQTDSREVCDNNSNCDTAGPYTFKVDKKDPTFSCDAAPAGWSATDVTRNCTANDGGSGLATPTTFTLSTNVLSGTETANAQTGSTTVSDNVGHDVTAGPLGGNKVDKKAPGVSCDSADGAWHAADVSIACTASDGGSGLADSADANFLLSTNVPDGTETANASTGSHAVVDAVGNSATAGPISGNKVDKKAPTYSCDAPDGLWHATDVSLNCTASDGGSGLATSAGFTLSTNVADGTETANASTGSATVSDNVGHDVTAGPISGNKVDKKAPTIAITAPTATNYLLNQAVAASFTCNDGGSDVASCVGTVANGSNIDTASIGTKTFTVNASDNVGNLSSASVSYSVNYNWNGFFQPVDNNMLNIAKAGQAIPLKWRLTDANGNPVLNLTSVKVTVLSLSCTLGTTTDLIEEYAAGASGLQNLGDGYYQFNWKTPTSYANSCKTMKLDLGDGVPHTAQFQFKK